MKPAFYILFFFLAVVFVTDKVQAQPVPHSDSLNVMEMVVVDGDTIPMFRFPVVYVRPPLVFKNKREKRQYGRLKRYVVKVYPYAEVAGEMLKDFDDTLRTIKSEKKRKKYLESVEEELKAEFEGELKNLTIKQGIILVKLIDRETGNTSYELIKSLRGSFSAFLWQSLARLFGQNLKLEYDPDGEDYLIEEIVQQIESGEIPYEKRKKKS